MKRAPLSKRNDPSQLSALERHQLTRNEEKDDVKKRREAREAAAADALKQKEALDEKDAEAKSFLTKKIEKTADYNTKKLLTKGSCALVEASQCETQSILSDAWRKNPALRVEFDASSKTFMECGEHNEESWKGAKFDGTHIGASYELRGCGQQVTRGVMSHGTIHAPKQRTEKVAADGVKCGQLYQRHANVSEGFNMADKLYTTIMKILPKSRSGGDCLLVHPVSDSGGSTGNTRCWLTHMLALLMLPWLVVWGFRCRIHQVAIVARDSVGLFLKLAGLRSTQVEKRIYLAAHFVSGAEFLIDFVFMT